MSRRWLVLLAALVTLAALGWSARPQPLTASERVDRISAELRCPVCQGLSVQDSPSETARNMRDLVEARVAAGRTDEQIRDEFRRSYGDWILLSPPLLSPSGLVWIGPVAAVLFGALLALRALRKTRAPVGGAAAEPTAAEIAGLRAQVARDDGA
ncbi:MAG TPA: cytochrome c-type biogenesis protein CcmH [Candidatus Limnocylindria bacterium]|nr:cytochrome c-type biogenesis protein CcmH [Candidatus Limnocylindria bacterium]